MTTKKERQTRSSRNFLLTLNQIQYFDDVRMYIESLKTFRYGIAAKENAPTTGHKHIHIFIQFRNSMKLNIDKLYGCHVDKCYGSPQQNKDYVMKEGDIIWERGQMKRKGGYSIKEVEEMSQEKRKDLSLIYYKTVDLMNSEESCRMRAKVMKKFVKVYYISGPSGIGKTEFAKGLIGNETFCLVKYENGFWVGVSKTRIALYDDWRDSHMKPSEFINFIDYNKQIMNVKHGYKLNEYSIIIITSILRLDDIYSNMDAEYKEQWKRRAKEIKLSVVYRDDLKKYINFMINKINNLFKLIIYKKLKFYFK